MTEHNNKDNCITGDSLTHVTSMLIDDVALDLKEIEDIFDNVKFLMYNEVADPLIACSDEFDLKSLIAGTMILTILVSGMLDHKDNNKPSIMMQNASQN